MSDPPIVSIVIPCRKEEAFIGRCLDSILANDYPKDRLEILVVDGMSEDGTRTTVQDFARKYGLIRLLDNPKKITPAALNVGIAHAKGDIIMRMDAHNTYEPHYISALVGWLEKTQADNVGGLFVTIPATRTFMAEAIARALAHPFGVGNAYFRIGVKAPRWVDTVPFGCYRREVFDRIGMFDEELIRNQDDELNLRLIRQGGRILLIPDIISYYHARASLSKVWRMYYQYGYFKPLVIRKIGGIMTVRQVIPALFVLSLLLSGALAPWTVYGRWALGALVVAYMAADLGASIGVGIRYGVRCALAIPIVFPVLHVSYGLGFLKGALDFFVRAHKRKEDASGIPITR